MRGVREARLPSLHRPSDDRESGDDEHDADKQQNSNELWVAHITPIGAMMVTRSTVA
jgi:hypothetical protein